MKDRLIFVEAANGSFYPVNQITEVSWDDELQCNRIRTVYGWTPICANGTFTKSLRVLDIEDDRIAMRGYSDVPVEDEALSTRGILEGIDRIIVQDMSDGEAVATITKDGVDCSDGYCVRLRPIYSEDKNDE